MAVVTRQTGSLGQEGLERAGHWLLFLTESGLDLWRGQARRGVEQRKESGDMCAGFRVLPAGSDLGSNPGFVLSGCVTPTLS